MEVETVLKCVNGHIKQTANRFEKKGRVIGWCQGYNILLKWKFSCYRHCIHVKCIQNAITGIFFNYCKEIEFFIPQFP